MKTILSISMLIFILSINSMAQQYDTLDNKAIISLTKMGLPPQTIISKIKTSINSFDVSLNGLAELSNNGVHGDVINEMINIMDKVNVQIAEDMNSNNPDVMRSPGIYYFNPFDTVSTLTKIQIVRITSYATSSGGYGGYGGGSTSAIITGSKSKQQISEQNPIFYFYFHAKSAFRDDWFQSASSPNEFSLVKVIEKPNQRLFKVGSTSHYGVGSSSSRGIPDNNKIPFEMVQVSEGIFKVTFSNGLLPGEYCFVFASETDKVFDFGIIQHKSVNTKQSKTKK